jgi:competence protein ComEC
MGLGYAYLPFAAAFPGAAPLPAAVLAYLVEVFSRVSRSLDAFPFLSFRVPTPAPAVRAGYFLSLGLLVVRPRLRGQRPATLALLLLFSGLLVLGPFRASSPDLRVTLIDVGQGESILVEFPGRRTMLIDGGGLAGSSFDVGERVVSPVLWRKGLRRIDTMVLTHAHPDHLGGLVAVARNFKVGEFWEGPRPPDRGLYADLGRALGSRVVRRRVGQGARFTEGGVAIEVLHPPLDPEAGPVPAANETSLVIRMTFGEISFLFMADTGSVTERSLAEAGTGLTAEVLKAGHHGSAGSTSAALLAAVRPRLVLVSAGEGNTYGFPSPDVLTRCREAGAAVLRTDLDGAVEVRTDGRTLRARRAAAYGRPKGPDSGLTRTTKWLIIDVD